MEGRSRVEMGVLGLAWERVKCQNLTEVTNVSI